MNLTIINIIRFIFTSFFGGFISLVEAQNIALFQRYDLSALPNYAYTAPSTDKTSLTDGIYTKSEGYFWTHPTTVGWQGRQVTITIDLGKIQPIEQVTFNTVRKSDAGAFFPRNVYVFFSLNGIGFRYMGDGANDPDNVPGPYIVKKLTLKDLNGLARYITLKVIPDGNTVFCDEVEVLKGKKFKLLTNGYTILSIDDAVDSLKSEEFNRRNLLQIGEVFRDRNLLKKRDYDEYQTRLKDQTTPNKIIQRIKSEMLQDRISALRAEFSDRIVVEKYNPWNSLIEFLHVPRIDTSELNFQFSVPVNGEQYGAFVITNLHDSNEHISFHLSNSNPKVGGIKLFMVPFVSSINNNRVADPLVPIKDEITINSGISQLFIFSLNAKGEGVAQFSIDVSSGSMARKLSIIIRSFGRIIGPFDSLLSANVWGYLHCPIIRSRQKEAVNDLENHHLNSIVVPPVIIPKLQDSNYTVFIKYVRTFNHVRNFLIAPNYKNAIIRNGYKGGHFLSAEWKTKFLSWYKNIISVIRNNGFPDAQVLLYPYDEIHGKDIADFEKLILWAKQSVPGIKFYATLGNKPAVDTLLPLLDIAQIHTDYKGIDSLPAHKGEVWMYSVKSAARSLSPYGYYRLMAWRAFANDFTGIGFWNYADEGRDKVLNLISDPFTNPATSFSVIYDGPGKEIISSRRWEAFRLGIEDYSIITAYSKKFGVEKVKVLVQQVLNHPEDFNQADKIREQMIDALVYKL